MIIYKDLHAFRFKVRGAYVSSERVQRLGKN